MTGNRRRRAAVLAAIAEAALVTAAGASAADASSNLARRYAPVLRLVEQEEPCGHGEPFVPTNVNLLLGSPDVALRGPWDTTNVIKVAPTGRDLERGLFDYHLDFPGTAVRPGCVYDAWSRRINHGHAPTMYARVVNDFEYPDQLALQYWFFYVFNDFNDKHEGDWEMIQLDFEASTPEQALHHKPALVGYSQHEGGESAHWGDSKLQIVDGTHPVVYPALGSHANYYTSALHLGRSAAQGVGCDETSGPSIDLRPDVALVPTTRYLSAYPWLGFVGHWGEEHQSFYNGPTGPNTKLQWNRPIAWANRAWHDKSFTVPAGTSLGGTATGFFCGAVAAGSSLLTAIVGNPSPVYIAFAVLFLLLLWLASRTRWQPSAPLRLERRRRWGAIVNASRRMYLGHLRVFLGIGLLFFPLGVVITGIQYLLFRVGGLSGLVDSVGSTNAAVDLLAVALGILFTIFGLAIVTAATAVAMVEIDAGGRASAAAAYRRVLPKVGPIVGVVFVAALIISIVDLSSIGLVLATWLIVRWALVPQIIVLEEPSGETRPYVKTLRRSARLVRGNWWRVAAMLLFVALVALLLGPLVGTLLLFVSSASFNFINFVSSVVYAVVLPFVAIVTTYLYFDLRVRKQHEAELAEAGDVLPAETATPGAALT